MAYTKKNKRLKMKTLKVELVLFPSSEGVRPYLKLFVGNDVYEIFSGQLPPLCTSGSFQRHENEIRIGFG